MAGNLQNPSTQPHYTDTIAFMAAPVWLVDEPIDSETLVPTGWKVHQGFEPASTPWLLADHRIICVGNIENEQDGAAALLALARGAVLLIHVNLNGHSGQRLIEDLCKVAKAHPLREEGSELKEVHVALLDALAKGVTVSAAAVQLHLSRRTANRRLAEIRELLDVGTNAEAVSLWIKQRRDPTRL